MSQSSTTLAPPQQTVGPDLPLVACGDPGADHLGPCGPAAAAGPGAARLVLFRDLRRRDRGTGDRAAAQSGRRSDRPVAHRAAVALRAVRAGRSRQAGLQTHQPDDHLGAVRLLQHHGLAGRRRVHVRAGLPEERAGPPHRAAAGARTGPQHAAGRLRHDPGRCRPGAVHPLQHRAQRRHPVPDRQQPAVALRLEAERSVGTAVRRLHHVDDLRRRLRDQLAVHDRLRAELPRDRVHRQDRARPHHLPGMDEGLAAVRAAAAAGAAAAGLCAVSARGEAQHRGGCVGQRRTAQDRAPSQRARSSWRYWSPAPSCSG